MRLVINDKIKEQLEQLKEKLPFLKRFIKSPPAEEEIEDASAQEEVPTTDSSESTDVVDASDELNELEEREVSEPQWKVVLKKQLPFLAKVLDKIPGGAAPKQSAASDKTDVGVKAPADQKQKIIRLIIGAVIIYALYDTVLKPTEEGDTAVDTTAEAPAEPKPRKKKRPPTDPAVTAEPAPSTDPAATAEPAPSTDPAPVAEPTPTTDPTSEPTVVVTPAVESTPTPDTTPTVVEGGVATDITLTSGEGDDDVDADVSMPVEGTAPEDAPQPPPSLGISEDGQVDGEPGAVAGPEETPPIVGGETETPSLEAGSEPSETPDMTEKILKDLEKQVQGSKENTPTPAGPYVAPPDYENFGRGLVYNCKDKHWACIDGASYSICQQNYGSLKADGKPKECYPDSVYQTEKSCVWMQNEKITSGTKTDFCQ